MREWIIFLKNNPNPIVVYTTNDGDWENQFDKIDLESVAAVYDNLDTIKGRTKWLLEQKQIIAEEFVAFKKVEAFKHKEVADLMEAFPSLFEGLVKLMRAGLN